VAFDVSETAAALGDKTNAKTTSSCALKTKGSESGVMSDLTDKKGGALEVQIASCLGRVCVQEHHHLTHLITNTTQVVSPTFI
jgi:hypothetical protein